MRPIAELCAALPGMITIRKTGPIYICPFDGHPEATATELEALPWWTRREARHEYFMTRDKQVSYAYDAQSTYNSEPMTPRVEAVMDFLNMVLKTDFNGVFLNKYDNERQHIGWHADDGEGMEQSHPIAVVSYGAEREIWVKRMDAKGKIPDEDRYLLQVGSLFIMPAGFQETHYHRIPKHDRPCGARMSLTFRCFK